jgi:gamma-D-glutamyl-L-lysine dipeptidyl-peptidase
MAQYGIVHSATSPVREKDSDRSEIVTQLLFGEGVLIESINSPWALIECLHDGYKGYVDYKQLIILEEEDFKQWNTTKKIRLLSRAIQILSSDGPEWIYQGSLLPIGYSNGFKLGEKSYSLVSSPFELARNTSIIELAQNYINTPYLWGGRSITGIDCSGYTQIILAAFNISVQRDASQQAKEGTAVSFEDIQAGDLAFFHNSKGNVIHVGILTGLGTILHASGKVREDQFTEKGIYRKDFGKLTHNLTCIRRFL